MNNSTNSTEEKILQIMKRVLTDVARDTYTQPGLKHPLTENTILGIRDCLALITARETEIANLEGRENKLRPHFIDEPRKKKTSVVINLDSLNKPSNTTDKN